MNNITGDLSRVVGSSFEDYYTYILTTLVNHSNTPASKKVENQLHITPTKGNELPDLGSDDHSLFVEVKASLKGTSLKVKCKQAEKFQATQDKHLSYSNELRRVFYGLTWYSGADPEDFVAKNNYLIPLDVMLALIEEKPKTYSVSNQSEEISLSETCVRKLLFGEQKIWSSLTLDFEKYLTQEFTPIHLQVLFPRQDIALAQEGSLSEVKKLLRYTPTHKQTYAFQFETPTTVPIQEELF